MRRVVIVLAVAIGSTIGLFGCASGGHHAAGGAHHSAGKMPVEAGQGGFAALAEIVSILEQDPNTDWEKVDIDGLRRHLVDMNALTLNANVQTEVADSVIVHEVSGEGTTLRAIRAMVPAHAAEMKRSYQWDTETENTDTGVRLTLKAKDPQQMQQFTGLGFFGFMATGSHHQMHHLMMATGQGHAH